MNSWTCPICEAAMPGAWQDWPEYPFCSPRCRKIDLGRWLAESYRVPAIDDDDDTSPAEESASS